MKQPTLSKELLDKIKPRHMKHSILLLHLQMSEPGQKGDAVLPSHSFAVVKYGVTEDCL